MMASLEAGVQNDDRSASSVCVLKKYSTCSAVDKERVLRCERAGCPKSIHRSCSLRVTEPFRDDAEPFHVVCGKRCFNALSKGAAVAATASPLKANDATRGGPTRAAGTRASPIERKKRAPWSSDGPTPEINSLNVLLDWLRDPKNYARWVNNGDETKYETKAAMAAQILAQIKARGVDTDRNPNDVFAKIYQLEKGFTEASEWLRKNQDTSMDTTRLVEGAKQRCTYYYELVGSMGADHSKGKSNGAASTSGSRKRGAAAAANDADKDADATKRHRMRASGRDLRPRNAEMNNRAVANIQPTIAARVAVANKGPVTPEKATTPTTITPVLMNHSFLKASSNALAPKKPSQDSVNAAHMAALNASFLLASTIAAANAQPPKGSSTSTSASTTTSTTTAIVSATPANTSSSTFGGSHRQTTGYSSTLRPKPAILGTTAAGLAELNAAKARQAVAAKAATSSSTAANASSVTTLATANSPASTAGNDASGSLDATPPMGFSTSMLQVNNSMLQATAEKLQAEAKIATITANTALLRARKTLRDEGIPQTEIDAVLPLARH